MHAGVWVNTTDENEMNEINVNIGKNLRQTI